MPWMGLQVILVSELISRVGSSGLRSDIAFQKLEPLFMIGGSLTGIFLVVTVLANKADVACHEVEHQEEEQRRNREPSLSPKLSVLSSSSSRAAGDEEGQREGKNGKTGEELHSVVENCKQPMEIVYDERSKKFLSTLTVVATALAVLSIVLLGIRDSFRFTKAHHSYVYRDKPSKMGPGPE